MDVGHQRVILSSVYDISGMDLNILSCSRLDESGVTTTMRNGKCTQTDRKYNMSFANFAKRDNVGLFVKNIVSMSAQIVVNVTVIVGHHTQAGIKAAKTGTAVELWYQRLGHANRRMIKSMLSDKKKESRTKMNRKLSTAYYVP